MMFSIALFIVFILVVSCTLFFIHKIRPSVPQVLIGIGMVGIPAILCYLYIVSWVGLLYLGISMIGYFYCYTKNVRVLLDVCILLIISIVSQTFLNMIEINIYWMHWPDSFLFRGGTLTANGISILTFLFFYVVFSFFYYIFIKKTWNTMVIPVISQVLFITIGFVTVTVLSLNMFFSLSDNLYYPAKFNFMMQALYFIIMFILFTLLLRNTKKQNMIRQRETNQELLFQYMHALEQVNKDMQRFRHDYQNILLTMQGYMNENDLIGLKDYFNERIVKVENRAMGNNYTFNQLDNIKLIELKGMLSTKILLAQEWEIEINVEVPDTIDRIEMDIIDLTRIMGILMDNAVEACVDTLDKQLNLALIKMSDNATLIILENGVNSESIHIESLFAADYSTKGNNQGMGLTTVRQILKDYPNITMNTRIENGLFIHEIEIKSIVSSKGDVSFQSKKMA